VDADDELAPENVPCLWRAAREAGAAADWDECDLPAPAVRAVVAAVEEAGAFGARCAASAARLGLTEPRELSVLGGAHRTPRTES
jgi:hypothetical protein